VKKEQIKQKFFHGKISGGGYNKSRKGVGEHPLRNIQRWKENFVMKLFKRLMTALLAGVLAMGMLAGCSGAPAAPNTPLPNDAEALALYQGVSETCKNIM